MSEILTDKYEINKPSYLTQIVYYDSKTNTITPINPAHLDLVNSMYYIINKSMKMDTIDAAAKQRILECEDDDTGSEAFEIKMKDISTMTGKYTNSEYGYLIEKIHELRHIDVVINALNKDKNMTRTTASVIGNINEVLGDNKSIKAEFPRILVKSYYNTQKYFKKHYLTIQFSLRSKYAKLLYELAKDYEGLEGGKNIELSLLQKLLNVTTESMLAPSRFKAHVLKRTVEEINEATDIKIEWSMTKVKNEYIVNIKSIKQDDAKLSELGLIESAITTNPHYARSNEKLNKMIERGYTIQNKDAWIAEDINRNGINYEAMDNIDEFNQTEQSAKNEFFGNMAKMLKAQDPIINIENYIIKEIFGTKTYSNDAKETYDLILKCYDEFYE